MATRNHWEQVYGTEAPTQVSWFTPHLETSLALIERAARSLHAEFGPRFRLIESSMETHHTPFETTLPFLYCRFIFDPPK